MGDKLPKVILLPSILCIFYFFIASQQDILLWMIRVLTWYM